MKDCCGTCKCFLRRKLAKESSDHFWVGLCRLSPPQIAVVETQVSGKEQSGGNVIGTAQEIVSHFPSVREIDWCKKFDPGKDQTYKSGEKDEKEGGYF